MIKAYQMLFSGGILETTYVICCSDLHSKLQASQGYPERAWQEQEQGREEREHSNPPGL